MMPSINRSLFQLVAGLAFVNVARACAYARMLGEPADDMEHRFCMLGCNDKIKFGDTNFDTCCVAAVSGATVAATCTSLVSSASAAGVTTCPYGNLPTTASTGKAAPTDYVPAYPTQAPAGETSDTAGQSYASSTASAGSAITTWVTETASPDCATTAVAGATTSAPAVSETTAASTCACPDPYATGSSAAPETSDTQGQSWSSSPEASAATTTDGGATPSHAGSKPEGDVGGLDRRTEIQYTCECPAGGAPAETSDTAGQGWSSSAAPAESTPAPWSSEAPPAEATDDCIEDNGATPDDTGDKPTEDIQENAPLRRFIPLKYPIGHSSAGKRAYERPPPSFVPEDEQPVWLKRAEPTDVVSEAVPSAEPTTVTSTTTVTGTCPVGGATYPTDSAVATTSAVYGGVVSGGISGDIGGSSFAVTGQVTLPSDDAGQYSTSAAPTYAGNGPTEDIAENAEPTQ